MKRHLRPWVELTLKIISGVIICLLGSFAGADVTDGIFKVILISVSALAILVGCVYLLQKYGRDSQ